MFDNKLQQGHQLLFFIIDYNFMRVIYSTLDTVEVLIVANTHIRLQSNALLQVGQNQYGKPE